MTSCMSRDMRVRWPYHGRVSSVVDSFAEAESFLKDTKLSPAVKCFYKVNLNFHR